MNTITIAPSFLENLRKDTNKLHIALEELPISKSIISPEITVDKYVLYLSLMYNVVKDAEENIYPVLDNVITDLQQRRKSIFITDDLNNIGNNNIITENPLSKNQSGFTKGFALGIMYVIEGSTLGGRVILKNISSVLGYNENTCARYFAGYGNKTGSTWKSFLDIMCEYEHKYQCGQEIIAGANFAFNTIAKYFKENSSI